MIKKKYDDRKYKERLGKVKRNAGSGRKKRVSNRLVIVFTLKEFGTHNYEGISRAKVDEILRELAGHGSTITGDNPWAVVTNNHGVTLRGEWNERDHSICGTRH